MGRRREEWAGTWACMPRRQVRPGPGAAVWQKGMLPHALVGGPVHLVDVAPLVGRVGQPKVNHAQDDGAVLHGAPTEQRQRQQRR